MDTYTPTISRDQLSFKIMRGRTFPVLLRFLLVGEPIDISAWSFIFTIASNTASSGVVPMVLYNPVVNLGDATQGILSFNVYGTDTEPLKPCNALVQLDIIPVAPLAYPPLSGQIYIADRIGPVIA